MCWYIQWSLSWMTLTDHLSFPTTSLWTERILIQNYLYWMTTCLTQPPTHFVAKDSILTWLSNQFFIIASAVSNHLTAAESSKGRTLEPCAGLNIGPAPARSRRDKSCPRTVPQPMPVWESHGSPAPADPVPLPHSPACIPCAGVPRESRNWIWSRTSPAQ